MAQNSTIYDVSCLSGVSIATVSRVFSAPDRVRETTRKKVLEAAEALAYSPNAIARAMAKQQTDRIAYLICKKGAGILDEFYAGICEGIMEGAGRADYQLLISTADDWQTNFAQTKQIEGVILGGNADMKLVDDFRSRRTAVVMVNTKLDGVDLPTVVSDEQDGVRQVVEHLLGRGHRRIGMVMGRFHPYIVRSRYSAFLSVAEEHGCPVRAEDVRMCNPDIDSSIQAALELLDRPDRPTALFGANDVVAAGIIKAARRLGLNIPRDLAVAGFDDSSICGLLEPCLTSVHTNCRAMGEICVERLTAVLRKEANIPRLTVLPARLVVRDST